MIKRAQARLITDKFHRNRPLSIILELMTSNGQSFISQMYRSDRPTEFQEACLSIYREARNTAAIEPSRPTGELF